jgi:hypothetical protein
MIIEGQQKFTVILRYMTINFNDLRLIGGGLNVVSHGGKGR